MTQVQRQQFWQDRREMREKQRNTTLLIQGQPLPIQTAEKTAA